MIDVEVIHSKTFSKVPLSSIESSDDIMVCKANVDALCHCIAALATESQLWIEPNPAMIQAGLAEIQNQLDEWDSEGHIQLGRGNEPVSDDQASDLAVFVLQAMAGKRNG